MFSKGTKQGKITGRLGSGNNNLPFTQFDISVAEAEISAECTDYRRTCSLTAFLTLSLKHQRLSICSMQFETDFYLTVIISLKLYNFLNCSTFPCAIRLQEDK